MWRQLLGKHAPTDSETANSRRWLKFGEWPPTVYAIGDVHGRLDLLRQLENAIIKDARPIPGEKWMVLLGDYVDRGPHSAQVLDHLTRAPPTGFRRICLAGNHELMMRRFLEDRRRAAAWLNFGGLETLLSYGIPAEEVSSCGVTSKRFGHLLDSHIPQEHLEFLRGLPLGLELPGCIFVHAGIRPERALSEQSDDDLTLRGTDLLLSGPPTDMLVVHGHRIFATAHRKGSRVSLDTGAYATGRLSCARIFSDGGDICFLVAESDVTVASESMYNIQS